MRRTLALVLGALILLAGLWAVRAFLGGSPRSAQAVHPEHGPRADAPERESRALADLGRDGSRPESSAAPREDARAAVATAAPQAELAVQVVQLSDALTREALAGARLAFAVVDPGLALEQHPGWKLDTCDAWLAEHGSETHSDAGGRAELRAPAGSLLLVAAWAPQRFGRALCVLRQDEPQPLLLKPDVRLEVHTVDSGGSPLAGATVALRRSRNTWGARLQEMRTSDASGRVVYPHVGAIVDLADGAWAVTAPSLLGRVERIELDPRALPETPLRLVFPATGSVEVRVSSAPGLPPVEDDVEVELLIDEGRPDALLSFWTRPDSVSARVDDGVARFDFVPVGLDLIAEARPDSRPVPTRARGRGPDSAGRTAALALVLGADHPVVRLRLLDAGGAALVQRRFQARLDLNVSDIELELESDGLGRVHFDVPAQRAGAGVPTFAIASTDGPPAASARLDLPGNLRPGLNDLGDLTLEADRALVAGRVSGPDGSPVAGVGIHLASLVSLGEGQTWVNDLSATAESAEDGTFAVYGEDPGTTLRVLALGDGWRSAPVDCAAGTAGLSLVVAATGSVAGRVLLDADLDESLLHLRLRPAGEGESGDYRLHVRAPVRPNGTFQAVNVSPGRWDLEFLDGFGSRPVARVEGIEVPSGALSDDPRLREIDLRGRLTVVRLSIQPPRASDLVLGTLSYGPAGSPPDGEDRSTAFLRDANPVLFVAGRAADVSVRINGFRAVELAGVRGYVTVELERGPAVRLRLAAGAELPKPPRFLKPFLTASEDDSSMGGHFQSQIFDERRELLLHAPTPGRLRVQWLLEERGQNSLSTHTLEVPEPQWIEVLDVSGEQTFEVVVPAFDP